MSTVTTTRRFPRTVGRLLLILALALGSAVGIGVATAQPALASCSANPAIGNWHNTNANTRAMTRVTVGFVCGDVILCDPSGHCTGGDSYFTVHPYGACSPTDCDWGAKRATPQVDGWLEATFNFGFKTSYVWVKTYVYSTITYLRVYVYNDFTPADGRTDYTTDEWMVH